jgi:hypothetical protein
MLPDFLSQSRDFSLGFLSFHRCSTTIQVGEISAKSPR